MRPLRQVVNVAHVLAFRLDCGHTIYRPPLTGKHIIPKRAQCLECEMERTRINEWREVYESGMKALADMHPDIRKLLDIRQTKPVA